MKISIAIILICLFAGCTNESINPIDTLPPLQFETVLQSSRAFGSEDFVAVTLRSKAEENVFFQTHPSSEPFPDINYSQNMVIGILLGMRESISIRLNIDSVKQVAGSLKVYAHEYHPRGQRMQIGYPAHFIVLKKIDLAVQFEPVKVLREGSRDGIYGTWFFEYFEDINSGTRELPPHEMGEVTIEFHSSGGLTGLGPCNVYSGNFHSQDGDLLTISSLRSTMRACALDILNQWEARYFAVLHTVTSYELTENRLKLISNQNRLAIVFR